MKPIRSALIFGITTSTFSLSSHAMNYPPLKSRRSLVLLVLAGTLSLIVTNLTAQVNLEILRREGYGVANIKQPRPNDLVVEGSVNGRRVSLVLDTGFGEHGVSLDSSFTGTLGTKPVESKEFRQTATGKKVTFKKAVAQSFSVGNVLMKDVPIHFGIFQGLRESEIRRIIGADGYLGSGFLRTCSAIVDLLNKRLYLRPPGTGRRVMLGPALKSAGLSETSFLQVGDSNCFVDVEINGVASKMIIDTGASLSTIDGQFAKQIKANPYRSNLRFIDVAGVQKETDRVPIASFKIGGISLHITDLELGGIETYNSSKGKVIGVLGLDILGQYWSIIDFGQQKLYFAAIK